VTGQVFTLTDVSDGNSASAVWKSKELKPCRHHARNKVNQNPDFLEHILSFGKDPDGEIYVMKMNRKGSSSAIYRLKVHTKVSSGSICPYEVSEAEHTHQLHSATVTLTLLFQLTCCTMLQL